jgi:hypothetical protein
MSLRLLSPALLIAIACHGAVPPGLIEKSGEWEKIPLGEFLVENNTWNTKAVRPGFAWRQSVFADPATGAMGWRWDFSGQDGVTKSFPEIIYGKKAFDAYTSTTPRLPAPLATARFRLEYDYAAKATGTYNTSTDITFTDSALAGEKNVRAKLMIWFDHQNMPFFNPAQVTRAVIAGRPHQVFIDRKHAEADGQWIYIALLPDDMPARGELDLTEYFAHLRAIGVLQPGWFLASIEIGSEISNGTGEVTFRRFVVH